MTTDPAPTTAPPVATTDSRWSRRRALRAVGLVGATAAVTGTGLLSYRAYDNAVLDPGGGTARAPWREWRDVPGPLGAVAGAVLAASPHNTQPWSFAVGPTAISMFDDATRNTGSVDPYARERHVGLGCALENLVLACGPRGLEPRVELLPDGPAGERVAHVELRTLPAHAGPLVDAIDHRHTNRGPYEPDPLPPAILAGLADLSGVSGVALRWIDSPGPHAELGRLLIDAAETLIADDQQSRDNFAWFRGSRDEEERHRDGLVLDGQGLSPLTLGIAKLLPASSRSAGDRFWADATRTVHVATAAAYGVITAEDPDDRRVQLDAGRLLQRIHLRATAAGIALHSMNQITERIDRESSTGTPATFAPRFAALLPPGERPLLTFRIGRPVRAGRPTPRRTTRMVLR